MALPMKRYVIAVKREQRAVASTDWSDALRGIEDLKIHSTSNPSRIQVDASDQAIAEARRVLGDLCHIEPALPHRFV
jgi:hypothetical protein